MPTFASGCLRFRRQPWCCGAPEDKVIPPEQGEIYQKHIPHAHLIYIHGASHALTVAAAQKFSELATDFIERGEGFVVNRSSS